MPFIPDTPSDQSVPPSSGFTPDVGFEAQYRSSAIPALAGILSPEEFAAQYIQSGEGGGVVGRLKEQIAGPLTGVVQTTVKPILNLVPAAYNEAITNLQTKSLPSAIASNVGTGIKSLVEAARLGGSEVLNLPTQLNQLLSTGAARAQASAIDPSQNISQIIKDALESGGTTGGLVGALIPGRPSQEEISRAYESYVQQRGYEQAQAQPSQQIIGEDSIIPGRVNPELAVGIKEGAKLAFPLIGAQERVAAGALAKRIVNTVLNPSQAFPKIAARVAKPTPAQQADAAFDLNETQATEHLPVVIKNVQEITGILPKGNGAAQKALDLMDTAENKLYSNRLATNKIAKEQGLKIDLNPGLEEAKLVVNSSSKATQAEKELLINNLEDRFSKIVDPEVGHNIQKDLNSGFQSKDLDKTSLRYQAEVKIRNYIANSMDDITRTLSGVDERPYSEIGSLIETKSGLKSKIEALKKVESEIKTGLKGQKELPTIASSRYEAARSLVKGPRSPLRRAGIEALDEAVEGAFQGFEKAPTGATLTAQDIAAGRARFTTPQSTITGAEVPDLEALIEAKIKTYPKGLDPRLARLAAEAELGLRSSSPQ